MPAKFTPKYNLEYGWNLGEDPGTQPLDYSAQLLDSLIVDNFAMDITSTLGLVYGYRGGVIYGTNGMPELISVGTITVPPNSVSYIERNISGIVGCNQTGFQGGSFSSMARVVTNNIQILEIQDWRTLGGTQAQQVYIDTIAEYPTLRTVQDVLQTIADAISSGVGVSHVYGRQGSIIAEVGDYTASQITTSPNTNLPNGTPENVEAVLEFLVNRAAQTVSSFNARTGAITPLSGDYTSSQIIFVPPAGMNSTNAQAAIEELNSKFSGNPILSNNSNYSPFFSNPALTDVNLQLAATGGASPYTFALSPGSTLPGARIDSFGVLHSTIATSGNYVANISVNGKLPQTISFNATIETPLTITTPVVNNINGYGTSYQLNLPLTAIGGNATYTFAVVSGSSTSTNVAWPSPTIDINGNWTLSATIPNNGSNPTCEIYCSDGYGNSTSTVLTFDMTFEPEVVITAPDQSIQVDRSGANLQTSTFTIGVNGGYAPYVITPGIVGTHPGVSAALLGGNQIEISFPSTEAYGIIPLSINVTDSNGQTVVSTCNLHFISVSHLVLTAQMSQPDGFSIAGSQPVTITLAATGGSGDYSYLIAGCSPNNLLSKFGIIGNIVTFTPNTLPNVAQVISLLFQATDASGIPAQVSQSITMSFANGPVITSFGDTESFDTLSSASPGTVLYQLAANSDAGSNLVWSITDNGTMPSPSINGSNKLTFAAPAVNTGTGYYCTVECLDINEGLSVSQLVTIRTQLSAFHIATAGVGASGSTLVCNQLNNWTPNYIDPTGYVKIVSANLTDPTGSVSVITISDTIDDATINNGGGVQNDTITSSFPYSGSYSLALTVCDSGGTGTTASGSFWFTVTVAVQILTASSFSYNTAQNSEIYTGSIALSAVGGFPTFDSNGNALYTWSIDDDSSIGASATTFTITGQMLNFKIDVPGGLNISKQSSYPVTIRATDSTGNNSGSNSIAKVITFSATTPNPIVITTPNTAIISATNFNQNDGVYVTYNKPLIALTFNDSNHIGTPVWTVTGMPSNMTFSISGNNLVVSPNSNISTGAYTDSATITVTDSNGNTESITIAITLNITTQAYATPVITNASVTKTSGILNISCNGTSDSKITNATCQVTDKATGLVVANLVATGALGSSNTFDSSAIALSTLWDTIPNPDQFLFTLIDSVGNQGTTISDHTGQWNMPTGFSYTSVFDQSLFQVVVTPSFPGIGSQVDLQYDIVVSYAVDGVAISALGGYPFNQFIETIGLHEISGVFKSWSVNETFSNVSDFMIVTPFEEMSLSGNQIMFTFKYAITANTVFSMYNITWSVIDVNTSSTIATGAEVVSIDGTNTCAACCETLISGQSYNSSHSYRIDVTVTENWQNGGALVAQTFSSQVLTYAQLTNGSSLQILTGDFTFNIAAVIGTNWVTGAITAATGGVAPYTFAIVSNDGCVASIVTNDVVSYPYGVKTDTYTTYLDISTAYDCSCIMSCTDSAGNKTEKQINVTVTNNYDQEGGTGQ